MQGWSSLGHHTVVQFNNQEIVDVVWQGQVELVVDEEISSSLLSEDEPTNRVTIQAIADQAPFDRLYFNWFELQFRRLSMISPRGFVPPAIISTPSWTAMTCCPIWLWVASQ